MALNIVTDRRRGTWILALCGVAACLFAAALGVLTHVAPGEFSLLGMPAGLFLSVLAVPAILAGLVLASARLQDRIDRMPAPDERS